MMLSQKQRLAAIVEQTKLDGEYLPGGPQDRADCKVLVKKGVFEPNGRLGYRLATDGRDPLIKLGRASGMTVGGANP